MTSGFLGGCVRAALAILASLAIQPSNNLLAEGQKAPCREPDAEISLPKGFCATIFADHLGHARQLVAAGDGTIYVNTWSGGYFHNDAPPKGGFLVALKDTKSTGHAHVYLRFGKTPAEGGHGGTGIALYKNWLYAETNDRIVRYELKPGEPAPTAEPDVVLSGMPIDGAHPMHPFVIDARGNLFVSMGSATDACSRTPHAPGNNPCTELETRAGIWRYDANKLDQVFSAKERYATGLRNAEGLDFDAAGRLYSTDHGRGHLHENWPEFYTVQQDKELPSEAMVILKDGALYGWPMCYVDAAQNKLVLAPEYGGDGGRKIGACYKMQSPIASFPAHWAPNDLKIYKASAFPTGYQGGAFIAFHGSGNSANTHGGYNVVFQPLSNGRVSGNHIVFADGFAGKYKEPDRATHRPSGLAVGNDGALYISDDKAGRIWRVIYSGDPATTAVEAAQDR